MIVRFLVITHTMSRTSDKFNWHGCTVLRELPNITREQIVAIVQDAVRDEGEAVMTVMQALSDDTESAVCYYNAEFDPPASMLGRIPDFDVSISFDNGRVYINSGEYLLEDDCFECCGCEDCGGCFD